MVGREIGWVGWCERRSQQTQPTAPLNNRLFLALPRRLAVQRADRHQLFITVHTAAMVTTSTGGGHQRPQTDGGGGGVTAVPIVSSLSVTGWWQRLKRLVT